MNSGPPGKRCGNRAVEWMATAMMLGIAVAILLTPTTISVGSFRYIVQLGLSPAALMAIFLVVGGWRAVALWLNGNWHPYGPRLRAAGALAGAVIWALMALALAYLTIETRTISIGIPVYASLAGAEIFSCLRAGADARARLHG